VNHIVTTSDGSHTIYIPELDEHYHSVHGAIQESEHVFLKNGYDFCKNEPLNILEIGFGTGLNALLTALRAISGNRKVNYMAIEKYPVENKIVKVLNYPLFTGLKGKEIFNEIHSCEWGKNIDICNNFCINKIHGDLLTERLSGYFNMVYFDAFGPDKQPEMWTKNILMKISQVTAENGIFVTYSAKGEVRRNLAACGFRVFRLPGPPGKREMLRAIKTYMTIGNE